jgi:hypothetical protein
MKAERKNEKQMISNLFMNPPLIDYIIMVKPYIQQYIKSSSKAMSSGI